MASCAVPSCRGKKEFKFPKQDTMKTKWLVAIGRPDFKPNRWDGLCSKHFRLSDFVSEGFETGLPLTIRRLKRCTVPVRNMGTIRHSSSPKKHTHKASICCEDKTSNLDSVYSKEIFNFRDHAKGHRDNSVHGDSLGEKMPVLMYSLSDTIDFVFEMVVQK